MTARIDPAILADAPEMIALRRQIHAHPELRYEEVMTADLVASQLERWGIPVHRGLGGTGVVGTLRAGTSTRAIGLRADMDALPVQERNTFAHASRHPGKMHACGHDGHTAMLLAAARHLARTRAFDGTVHLIFQPAEEGGAGARAMIEDGLFERFPMDEVYGLHNWPGMPAGQLAASPGPVMASGNVFEIVVRGRGCHAALPHIGLDPVPVAAEIVGALQTILTRSTDPLESGVISVTTIHAGEAANVVPDECRMTGTVRTFSDAVLDLVERRMRRIVEHVCEAHDMAGSLEFSRGYPATINHPQQAALARRVMVDLVGESNVLVQRPAMTSEDFAFMLQARPGAYVFLGNGGGGHRLHGHGDGPCVLHNPTYDFNDEVLALGAAWWVRLAEACLPADGGAAG
jgi:amidohydrolase